MAPGQRIRTTWNQFSTSSDCRWHGRGAFAHSKTVPRSVHPGGDPTTLVSFAVTAIPVGLVDLMQRIARRFFHLATSTRAPPARGVS